MSLFLPLKKKKHLGILNIANPDRASSRGGLVSNQLEKYLKYLFLRCSCFVSLCFRLPLGGKSYTIPHILNLSEFERNSFQLRGCGFPIQISCQITIEPPLSTRQHLQCFHIRDFSRLNLLLLNNVKISKVLSCYIKKKNNKKLLCLYWLY